MESIIQVFRMKEVSAKARIKIMIKLGIAIDCQYSSNITGELVKELVLQLDPNYPINEIR